MNRIARFFGIATVLVMTGSGVAFGAVKIEGTPIPTQPKPDFSSMNFLVGSWTCSDLSSRRPGPFTTIEVYSMDPSGYFLIRNDTIHKASWIPSELHSQTKYTYDPIAKRWIRITTGDQGLFAVATAPNAVGNKKTYTYLLQNRAPDVSSYAPEAYTKVSDTEKTMTTSFTETGGRVITVKESCKKS